MKGLSSLLIISDSLFWFLLKAKSVCTFDSPHVSGGGIGCEMSFPAWLSLPVASPSLEALPTYRKSYNTQAVTYPL